MAQSDGPHGVEVVGVNDDSPGRRDLDLQVRGPDSVLLAIVGPQGELAQGGQDAGLVSAAADVIEAGPHRIRIQAAAPADRLASRLTVTAQRPRAWGRSCC